MNLQQKYQILALLSQKREQQKMLTYIRKPFTGEEEREILHGANRINQIKMATRLAILAALLSENAHLLREVNEHRATLGIEPLPAYVYKHNQ